MDIYLCLICLLGISSLPCLDALDCYNCFSAIIDTDSGSNSMLRNEDCEKGNKLQSMSCPASGAACMKMDYKVDMTAMNTESSTDALMRSCGDPGDHGTGCFSISEIMTNDELKAMMQQFQSDMATVNSVEGEVCFCDGNNCNGSAGVTTYAVVILGAFLAAYTIIY